MSSEDMTTKAPLPPTSRLRLSTMEASRKTLARFIKARHSGRMDSQLYKDLVYGMSQLLHYFKTETLDDLAERLEALEAKSD